MPCISHALGVLAHQAWLLGSMQKAAVCPFHEAVLALHGSSTHKTKRSTPVTGVLHSAAAMTTKRPAQSETVQHGLAKVPAAPA
jgi:hypothetical protein